MTGEKQVFFCFGKVNLSQKLGKRPDKNIRGGALMNQIKISCEQEKLDFHKVHIFRRTP